MKDLMLVRPSDLYAEQVMSYRKEMIKNGDSLEACVGLGDVKTFDEWINLANMP